MDRKVPYRDEYWDILSRALERGRQDTRANYPLEDPLGLGLRVSMPAIPLELQVVADPLVSQATPRRGPELNDE